MRKFTIKMFDRCKLFRDFWDQYLGNLLINNGYFTKYKFFSKNNMTVWMWYNL